MQQKMFNTACSGIQQTGPVLVLVPTMDVPQGVQDAVNQVLQAEGMPTLSQWNAVLSILEKHGLAWKQMLTACSLLVHPMNRAGMGVNSFAVHSKGASLHQTGFDAQHLHSSTRS